MAETTQESDVMERMTDTMAEQAAQINERRPKPISTKTHGILDYTLSPTLALAPLAFGFPMGGAATVVPRAYGAASMVYSAMTKYELGIVPKIPMRTHLIIDAASAAFMAVSPWVLGFGKRRKTRSWLPFLTFAATELAIVALSDDRSKR